MGAVGAYEVSTLLQALAGLREPVVGAVEFQLLWGHFTGRPHGLAAVGTCVAHRAFTNAQSPVAVAIALACWVA